MGDERDRGEGSGGRKDGDRLIRRRGERRMHMDREADRGLMY